MAVWTISGCAAANRPSGLKSDPKEGSVGGRKDDSRLETISYNWEDFGIDIVFTKRDEDSSWGMAFRDSWDIYDQFKEREKVWGGATSKCSQEECLRLIDRSLTEFQAEKPHARFEYVASASSSDPKSLVSNRPKRILIGELHQRRETLAYNWERQGIEVSFYRQDYDSYWTMTVRDSWSVMNQALSPNGEKKWGLSESKASMQECLRMIDQSLADFHTEKPTAKLQSIDIELQIIKELWGDILEGLRERLSTLSGEKSPGRFESGGPQNLDQELN